MKITRKNIWNFKQNKPSYVVKDLLEWLSPYFPADSSRRELLKREIYETLLRRGVFKWFAVRRDLIRLKNTWKQRVTQALESGGSCRINGKIHSPEWVRGYLFALQECRKEVRALCHSERWQYPDHDREAKKWLEKYELPEGVRIIAGHNGKGWAWVHGSYYPHHDEHTGEYFKEPEDAVRDCLEYYKKKNESVRRAKDSGNRSAEGHDANGSPVSVL